MQKKSNTKSGVNESLDSISPYNLPSLDSDILADYLAWVHFDLGILEAACGDALAGSTIIQFRGPMQEFYMRHQIPDARSGQHKTGCDKPRGVLEERERVTSESFATEDDR